MKNGHSSTLPPKPLTGHFAAEAAAEVAALVVLWSRHEPHRAGESLLIPDDGLSTPWCFGRGDASPGERRLLLARHRPVGWEAAGPLACPRVSRMQLRIAKAADGALSIENEGRCPMEIAGREVRSGALHEGEILELRNELLFLLTTRPKEPERRSMPSVPRFGEPDASGVVGESPSVWALRRAIEQAARRPEHVLITGPSGSGKELVARALHEGGARAKRSLIARNAATIPEGLVDAELFGNVKNYPNPGTPERAGLIGQADGSTLFLDEFAELSPNLQAHLLRVLDEGEYQRLGESIARRSDFRLIAATNRPVSDVKHDVLARLKIRVRAPGLSERRDDIPLIAAHLLRRHAALDPTIAERFFAEGDGGARPRLSPALVGALVRHEYTTHVRELDSLLLAAVLESRGEYIDLTEGVRERLRLGAGEAALPAPSGGLAFTPDELRRLEIMRRHRFRVAECGRDPSYPGNRQTADLHLRQLACKALQAADWDAAAAAAILAGGADVGLRERAHNRIETFLVNVERRLAPRGDPEADDERSRALIQEWRGGAELLAPLLDALKNGRIRMRSAAPPDADDR